jgi:molecular chaperone GrpE
MTGHENRPKKVKVMDKRGLASRPEAAPADRPRPDRSSDADRPRPDRRTNTGAGSDALAEPVAGLARTDRTSEEGEAGAERVARAEQDLLDDLRRLQAEFDNYRKRVLREQTAMASRASARLVERLLPVLDNFERAISHGEGGPGVALVHKELRQALEQEGLEEIEAEGATFDPRVHEAFQAVEDPDVDEVMVREVYRRGYKLGDQVLRPAMVVVMRPPEPDASAPTPDESSAGAAESGE